MTTRFTDELMEQGLTYKVLTLVSQIDVNNEFENCSVREVWVVKNIGKR